MCEKLLLTKNRERMFEQINQKATLPMLTIMKIMNAMWELIVIESFGDFFPTKFKILFTYFELKIDRIVDCFVAKSSNIPKNAFFFSDESVILRWKTIKHIIVFSTDHNADKQCWCCFGTCIVRYARSLDRTIIQRQCFGTFLGMFCLTFYDRHKFKQKPRDK